MADNFLTTYIRYNEGTEIPSMFALWCGLSGISAAVGRRIWMNMGKFDIFPNLYTILVAGSGRNRKSTAIKLVEDLLIELEPRPNLIAQQISPQALIDALRFEERRDSNGKGIQILRERGEGFVIADELVTFLNPNSYEAGLGNLLLTFFDCKRFFEYKTKSGGSQIIKNVCLGLLGGATPDLIMKAIPEEAVGHGLTSRFIFVYSSEVPEPIAWPSDDPELKGVLVRMLSRLQAIEGEMTLSQPARDFYAGIYKHFYRNSPFYDDRFLAAYASRRHVHLLKIAMLLALADESGKVVEKHHVAGAEQMLLRTEASMPVVMELVTSTKTGDLIGQVRNIITKAERISKVDLIRKMSNRLSVMELDTILSTLHQGGQVTMEVQGATTYFSPAKPKARPA